MIPKLFSSTETEFASYGIGSLPDVISCKVEEERNGIYEMTLTYPITGRHYEDIQYRSLILVKPNPYDEEQAFRVYRISKPLKGKVTIYAQHLSYDMGGIGLSPFSASSVTEALVALKENSIDDNPFMFSTDKGTQATMNLLTPSTVRTVLGGTQGSFIDVYGGEWKFDQYSAFLYNQRGKNRGVTLRYGKNLTDLKQEENCAKVCTAVYPYWTDGTNVVTLPEKTLPVRGGPFEFTRTAPLDFSQHFENQPTEEQLRNTTETYINKNSLGVPEVSLDVSFETLSKMTEYSELAVLEHIELCDTVTVYFEKLGVKSVAKVISYEYDVLNEKYSKISLGDRRGNIADTVVEQQVVMQNESVRIFKAIENATAWITGSNGGYVIFVRNEDGTPKELLIMDTPDIDTATNVWRWNQGGLGYSSSGYAGPYETAITQDGSIVGKFVTAEGLQVEAANILGKLTAEQIEAEELHVKAANIDGTLQASQIDAENLHVNAANVDGTIEADAINLNTATITGQLDAENIDVTNLIVKNANIESLYASKIIGGNIGGYMSSGAISDSGHSLAALYTNSFFANNEIHVMNAGDADSGVIINQSGITQAGTHHYWSDIFAKGSAVFG